MKIQKLFLALLVSALCTVSAFGQKTPVVKSKKHVVTHASVLKKNGKPDMRFKANKAAKGPLKKDGTPDMRFKANKAAKGPLTKSGKPDMRFKANKAAKGAHKDKKKLVKKVKK